MIDMISLSVHPISASHEAAVARRPCQTMPCTRSTLLDDGTTCTEVFRVRRIQEIDGRKRFVIVECEEEKNS
ncbi:hypothetical protein AA15237_3008 [Komagataeibacter xylinus NBRC 15237]|nr:hypothetical protein AA15237_3008 [Komagataeibacter xylinus NBRC 15237]